MDPKRPKIEMNDLPDEILLNIFHRLPIDSLGICMCVKKPWLSLIKSPLFISSYKTSVNDRYFIFYKNGSELLIHRDNERFEFHKQFTLPIETSRSRKFCASAGEFSVCNGVVCLAKKDSTVMLWNPTIRKTLTLPEPNFMPRGNIDSPVHGFGFDSTSGDYKVVRILNSFQLEMNGYHAQDPHVKVSQDTHVEVFSLNKNSWRIMSSPPRYIFWENSCPILNRVLHWKCEKIKHGPSMILGFDVSSELFREIHLPDSLDQSRVFYKLAVYKESYMAVCCFDKYMYRYIDIWVMNEYGNVESWTRIWKFNSIALQSTHHLRPGANMPGLMLALTNMLGLTNNGLLLLCVGHDKSHSMIMTVNPETGEKNQLAITTRKPYVSYKCFQYFEKSLVLLENTNAVSCPPSPMGEECNDDSSSDSSDVSSDSSDVSNATSGDACDDFNVESDDLLSE